MKTRLLKKVRKRFEIRRIDKIPLRPDFFIKWASERWSLPFYQIIDKNDDIGINNLYCTDKKTALEEICFILRKEYKSKSKQQNTKVWPL